METGLLLSALLVAAAPANASIRALAHDDYGNPQSWQRQRHAAQVATAAKEHAKVVFIGDSITHFWENAGRRQRDAYFSDGDYKMLNLGISADRTEHVLWRLNEGGALDGYEAKCILLMIGTNNTGHFPIEKESPGDTILGIREILNTIREKQPKATIVLTAIFPCGATADNPSRLRNDIVNKEIQKFADGRTIFWCDFSDQFLTASGYLSPDIFPDRLHPNALGYEIWASAVKPYIDFALSGGALPLPVNRFASRVNERAYRMDQQISAFPESRIRNEGYGKPDWWLDRLQEKRTQISDANGQIDLVFFGDSITHNWEGPGKESLDALRKTYSVLDIGYSGDKTENLLWRGEYGGELDGYKAKCVMLMIGTNNTWHRSDSPELIAAGVKEILNMIGRKQPEATTLLLPIFPFGKSPADAKRLNNEKANAIMKEFADGKKVRWVDFNAGFLDEKGDNSALMSDNCHPNAKGYSDVWLPSVLPYFKEICGK